MFSVYRSIVRPALFCLDPETAHRLSLSFGNSITCPHACRRLIHTVCSTNAPELQMLVADLLFANPVGLAAGWDKSAQALNVPHSLGFGFSEIGSVSADPSVGNPPPRLFRVPAQSALIVNYGVPNDGADRVADRLQAFHSLPQNGRSLTPLGINLVSTNRGPGYPEHSMDAVIADYLTSTDKLHHLADYLMLNLSCPNVATDEDFFSTDHRLVDLLSALESRQLPIPVFLKVPPDPHPASIDRLIRLIEPFAFIKGVCFNLPPGRPGSLKWHAGDAPTICQHRGAVSGRPVETLINDCIAEFFRRMPPNRFVIIGAGGVFSGEDAYRKICLGASLVQLYTALIYRGPCVVREILHGLLKCLQRDGLQTIQQAVGLHHRRAAP